MKKTYLSPRIFLVLAVVLGSFAMSVRVVNVWDKVATGAVRFSVPPQAVAKESAPAPSPAAVEPVVAAPAPEPNPSAPPPSLENSSDAELALLRQLSNRREQLEKRARELDVREALIKVSEQRVEQKISDLATLRKQVQSLINQAEGEQQTQIENLVKIYETMKPDEAARIFETMDMPVLLGVIQRMKPARTALVMAKLAPEKAKEITIALTRRDQLPKIK
ncbi:MAG: hypothetical protein PHS57_04915 [Alphaproteobacteria bacterium]|nr:hypothetical protein [Alphaproteobacteria bacterium]